MGIKFDNIYQKLYMCFDPEISFWVTVMWAKICIKFLYGNIY